MARLSGLLRTTDPEVVATVKAVHALSNAGCHVEGRLPVLEQTDANQRLWQLQQMESRPEFEKSPPATSPDLQACQIDPDTPDTPIADFVAAEQVERLAQLCRLFPAL
jgi:aspartyl-tRNA(Asn)/glutamyl-tRNA(Gln) amidotransferase subunit A